MRIILILLMLMLTACGGSQAVAPVGSVGHNKAKTTASHFGSSATSASVYKVKKGDTLYSISFRYGVDYKELAQINGIRPPYNIYVDQKIHFKKTNQAATSHNKSAIKPKNETSNAPLKWQAASQSNQQKKATTTKPATTSAPSSSTANQNLSWRWPTTGKVISTYSETAAGRKGIDIAGRTGQPVIASAAGKVVYSGNGLPRYGNLLIIKHNDVYLSAYAHNETLLVQEGQQVKAGQQVATLGRSGAQREQLHFEIRRNGKPVDPMRFLPKQ